MTPFGFHGLQVWISISANNINLFFLLIKLISFFKLGMK
jgi:hypothetical protein